MITTSHGLLGLIGVALVASACTDATVSSDAVRTKGIWASFTVKATGDRKARATAQLRVGGENGTVIDELVPPDELTFQIADGAAERLTSSCERENTFCTGNISENIESKVLTFAFDRDDEDESALDSSVKMPVGFRVESAVEDLVRGNDLPVEVSGSKSGLRWEVKGDCIWDESGTLSADAIPAEAFDSRNSKDDENCDVEVTFTRTATGDLDPNFGQGGEIKAIQERKFTVFTLAPGSVVSPSDSSSDGTSSSGAGDAGSSSSSEIEDAAASGDDAGSNATGSDDGGASDSTTPDATVPDATVLDAGADAAPETSSTESSTEPDAPSDAGDAG